MFNFGFDIDPVAIPADTSHSIDIGLVVTNESQQIEVLNKTSNIEVVNSTDNVDLNIYTEQIDMSIQTEQVVINEEK